MAESFDESPRETMSMGRDLRLCWRKSTWSIANGQCVEVAVLSDGRLGVRDSMNKGVPVAKFTEDGWHTFLEGIKNGDFNAM